MHKTIFSLHLIDKSLLHLFDFFRQTKKTDKKNNKKIMALISFIRKKKLILVLPLLFLHGCNMHENQYQLLLRSNFQNEGFLSNRIFQIKSSGAPKTGKNEPVSLRDRRKKAKQNAIANAKTRATEYILQNKIDAWQKQTKRILNLSIEEEKYLLSQIQKTLGPPAIVQEKYLPDGSCFVIARFQDEKLRKKMESIPIPQNHKNP